MRLSWALASSSIPDRIAEAKRCESNGLDGVWVSDHQAPFTGWPELYVSLTAITMETDALPVGSFVTDVLRRHPMVTAHAFASLSHLSGETPILGLGGGGGPSQERFGIEMDDLAARLKEGIQVINTLWNAEEQELVDYEGSHFSLENAGPPLEPTNDVPIYVASYGPRMLDLTARLANGWLPEAHTPQTYRDTLRQLHETMRANDRDPSALEACCALIFYPGEPDAETYDRLLEATKRYLACYPDILRTAGEGGDHPGLRTHQLMRDESTLERLAAQVPDDLADATLLYGTEAECRDRLLDYRAAGCQHVILEPYWIEDAKRNAAIEFAGSLSELLSN